MTTETLNWIGNAMQEMGIRYSLGRNEENPIQYPYWTGSYVGIPGMSEDGKEETRLRLIGVTRSTQLSLNQEKDKIERYFPRIDGKTAILPSGIGVAVFFEDEQMLDSMDAELRRMQINLKVIEFRTGG